MKTRIETTNPYAEVKLEPVKAGEHDLPKRAVMVMDDNGLFQPAGIVSDEYPLVQNSVVKDVFDDIRTRSDYDWKKLKTFWDGKRYQSLWITENPITTVKNGSECVLHFGIMERNTYDGSGAFGGEFFACNMVCTNQFHARNRFGFFSMRHVPSDAGKWDVEDAMGQMALGAKRLLEIAPIVQELMARPLTVEHILEAQAMNLIPETQWGNVLLRLSGEQKTCYGLFQALTAVTSHTIKGPSGLRYGDNVGSYFLKSSVVEDQAADVSQL